MSITRPLSRIRSITSARLLLRLLLIAFVLVLLLVGGLRVLVLLVVLVLRLLLRLAYDVAVLDLAAPRAGLFLVHLHEGLESLQVGARRALDHPRAARD